MPVRVGAYQHGLSVYGGLCLDQLNLGAGSNFHLHSAAADAGFERSDSDFD
jgi:hypothetical protein